MAGKLPTQVDVARLASVSQAMVSYVLAGKSPISIPEETRQRVLRAVEELGYVPNGTARSLRTRRTSTLGVVVPDITNPFYPAFERGVEVAAEERGYDLIVYNTDGRPEKERKSLLSLRQGRVDGLVAIFFHLRAPDLAPLLALGLPVVRLEPSPAATRDLSLPLDSLYVDNRAAAREAVEYLFARGHTRIGMVTGALGPGEERLAGYRRALAEHGLAAEPGLTAYGEFTLESGYQAMRRLLGLEPRPTAVFAANDMMALGALLAIRDAGLRVPEDLALVGFDDTPATRLVTPPLTTISQFQDRLGRRAAEMLFERLEGRAPPEGGRYEEMPYQLLARGSV